MLNFSKQLYIRYIIALVKCNISNNDFFLIFIQIRHAWTNVGAALDFDDNPVLYYLPFECGISSTTIIDKAEIGLKYTRAVFAKVIDPDKVLDANILTLYCIFVLKMLKY